MPRPKKKPTRAPAPQKAVERKATPGPASDVVRRATKTSELVALEIVRDIVARNLKPGDKLPLESELITQYRVSRSSLREALRLLEVQGLIAIRPGPGSGTMVGAVQTSNIARNLTLHFHMAGATYEELLNAWIAAEPLLARLAAQNPDRAKVREAMAPFLPENQSRHGPKWRIDEGLDFHARVGDLANNRVLALSLRSFGHIVTDQVMSSVERSELEDYIVHEHAELAAAITSGDADRAARLMEHHIRHVVRTYTAYWPRKVGERIQWR